MAIELDPQIAAAVAELPEGDTTPLAIGDIAGRRARMNPMLVAVNSLEPPAADVSWVDHVVTHDGVDVRARWYTKDDAEAPGSAVLYFHGGGMMLGDVPSFDGPLTRLVSHTGVPVLSVEYRLAPEHPYPAAVDDAYAALRWLHAHAEELGVDPSRIAVMGDSGGGGVAAALALRARREDAPAIARQILLFPMLDDRTTEPDEFVAPYAIWTYDDNATAWQAVLGDADRDRLPDDAVPARATDLAGLPPAYIEAGQLDIFRDEDVHYALALSHAGVNVELHLWSGAPHEFDVAAFRTDAARAAVGNRLRVLREL